MTTKTIPLRTAWAARISPADLLELPQLAAKVQALPTAAFGSLIRQIGVEDAGELVALATVEQLVAAFDEDLFVNVRPGERESFDAERFAVWLEVLLEAGEQTAAERMAAMSEDFVVQALASLVIVLEIDALRQWLSEDYEDAEAVDNLLASSPTEEIDGYLLVARDHGGWDAAVALILALDRDQHEYLTRVLDRCVEVTRAPIEEDGLYTVLSAADELAEQVEAQREARRAARGHVEPRAARAFLELAHRPWVQEKGSTGRDPLTRAYFRELDRESGEVAVAPSVGSVARQLAGYDDSAQTLPGETGPETPASLADALRALAELDSAALEARHEELIYLANVVIAGADDAGNRWQPSAAIEAVLATVALGARLEAGVDRPTTAQLAEVLRACTADSLFRRACAAVPFPQALQTRA